MNDDLDDDFWRSRHGGMAVWAFRVRQELRQCVYTVATHSDCMPETLLEPNFRDYGSFKDSLRSPIHRWFAYPAGYSYKMIEAKIAEYDLGRESVIIDPFLGSGTTALVAMNRGINSIGIEAHAFVADIARTKCFRYETACDDLNAAYKDLRGRLERKTPEQKPDMPELIYKCFDNDNLSKLAMIRDVVLSLNGIEKQFFTLALVSALRKSSTAGTGWPYIAPTKYAGKASVPDALKAFYDQCDLMLFDVSSIDRPDSDAEIITGDSRTMSWDGLADLAITSPPYLNNYDYADRTRLETYFLGIYRDWGDISRNVRDRLMMAATTQITSTRKGEFFSMDTVKSLSPGTHAAISKAVEDMGRMRKSKAGRKRYDAMTAGYFEDISKVIINMEKSVAKGGRFVLVLGDSAPYGVYVPTDKIIRDLALAAGFKKSSITALRTRGDKWRSNPQRHGVKLRESMVVLSK